MVVAPIAIACALGLIVGAARGGRLSALKTTRLRATSLLAVALVATALTDLLTVPMPVVWAGIGLLAAFGFLAANAMRPGMAVIGVGVVLNFVPLLSNGAMPVRGEALVAAGLVESDELDRVSLRGARELATSSTSLEPLGDVIPVPLLGQVLSFGDLVVLVGLADVITNLMRRRRPKRLPEGADATLRALDWDHPVVMHDGDRIEAGGPIDLREPIPVRRPRPSAASAMGGLGTPAPERR